ncbi:MAG TPA: hypothetical protein VGI98_06950 [Candidatus Limnocylindrales bacterium]
MFSNHTGLWPVATAPASEARDLAQRVALAQAKAAPDPHRAIATAYASKAMEALRRPATRIDLELA